MAVSMLPRSFVVGILIVGLTLFGLPLSVFSQTDTENQTGEVKTPPTSPGYTIETIPGDPSDVVGDFVVGPGKTELTIKPGTGQIIELLTTNRTGETRIFNLEVEDFTGSDDPNTAVKLLGDDSGPYTLKEYISVPNTQFELKHMQRARIPVTVRVPPDAEPGGRYGSVLVTTVSKDAEPGNTGGTAAESAIISRVGSLFFVTVPGEVARSGALEKFATIPDKKWFQNGPIQFELLYRNTGSIHVNPYGEIRITNMLGEEIGFVELDPWFALPGSLRLREVKWNREFLFGKYTAVANINRGYDDIIDTAQLTFWVIPWKIALGIFLVIFVVLYLIRAFFRTFEFKRKGS